VKSKSIVIEATKKGVIEKPIVVWAIGTCATMFAMEVQFGRAGCMAHSAMEAADAKNKVMREAGFIVPDTFEAAYHRKKFTRNSSRVVSSSPKPQKNHR
jgi:ATP citrate (pro-S)-lyase